ncbi:MAG: NUDIX hydrolase [Oscillospiraceae bacterium]|nr:NUDIX hydrolase [Oscillospiraceae bacterium]
MDLTEKTLTQDEKFVGRVVRLHVDSVALPDGHVGYREVVEHTGGVLIAPLTQDGALLFVRQFRYPYHKVLLELPAGKLEPGEDSLAAGLRELKEEVGAVAGRTRSLGQFYPTPGYCSEIIHMFLALDLTEGEATPDVDEFLEVERIALADAVQMVLSGEIADGKTQTAILKINAILSSEFE